MAKPSVPPGSRIPFLQFPDFTAAGKAAHGFFGRQGGVSGGMYVGLNCGIGSNDDPDHVRANRAAVAEAMGIAPNDLCGVYQVHGSRCIRIGPPHPHPLPGGEREKADAQVTDLPGVALSILTADCAPVLFYGEADGRPVIGAAHAGWRGAIGGVLEATVYRMEEYGVKAGDIRAAIGPCIGKRSYEVDDAFAAPFMAEDPENERFFMGASRPGHLMFDLPGYCARRLYDCGVSQVTISGVDTYAREEDYFSYRRTTHRKEPDYGRQISVIVIR
jgi:YfiH family protein